MLGGAWARLERARLAKSVGLRWRQASHDAMELRFDHLTTTGTNVVGLQFPVPF